MKKNKEKKRVETVKIEINTYTTPDGRPTCRLSPEERCPFLFCFTAWMFLNDSSQPCSHKFFCGASQSVLERYGKNNRDFIEPNAECLLRR